MGNGKVFAAFKVLPVDLTAQGRHERESDDPLADVKNCQEAVEVMVDIIRKACKDVGSDTGESFVKEEEIVRYVFCPFAQIGFRC